MTTLKSSQAFSSFFRLSLIIVRSFRNEVEEQHHFVTFLAVLMDTSGIVIL